jgi:hypothetical protein
VLARIADKTSRAIVGRKLHRHRGLKREESVLRLGRSADRGSADR